MKMFIHHALRLFVLGPLNELRHPGRGQIASLDFLRSAAVLLVLGFHFGDTYVDVGGRANLLSRFPLVRYGWMGVDLFFILSGYFIGRQLWRELGKTGTVDFGRFVLRRGFRIWPLYYAVFVFVAVVLGRGDYSPAAWWADVAFLSNYRPDSSVVSGGWSLSVEEQFYLLAPLLLLLGSLFAAGVRSYRAWLVGIFALMPLVRAFVGWRLTGDFTTPLAGDDQMRYLYMPIHTRADGLVMGLFLAHLDVADGDSYKRGFAGSIGPVVAAAGVFLVFRTLGRGVFNYTVYALLFGSITWFLLARRRVWLAVLELRLFYVLSRLSFGMYLNHFYLHEPMARFGLDRLPLADSMTVAHHAASFALFVAASAGVALLTFALIESPFLRLREWVYAPRGAE